MENNNIILNRMFTQSTFEKLIKYNESNCYSAIIKRYLDEYNITHKNNYQVIQEIYSYMGENYRNEYYYKNTLLNKLLLGRYSINTTTALSEVPISNSKADFILINNTATVYEIKTGLDTFERLNNQLKDYYKGFTKICVVTDEKNYEKIDNILRGTSVGIYILTRKNTLSRRKEPIDNWANLDFESMFKMLRKKEFENILLKYYGTLPKSKPVFYYKDCYERFKEIQIEVLYKLIIEELKDRVNLDKENFKKIAPYELKYLTYFSGYKDKDYERMKKFLVKGYEG